MKKLALVTVLLFSLTVTFAQDKKEEVKEGWTKGGNIAITFNQSAFNNDWTGGGISNLMANALINYDFNYVKGDLVWDNKFIFDYGALKNNGDDRFTKSNDRLEFNSLLGKKAKGLWFYSFYFNLRTQMDSGFDKDSGVKTTHFFSPAFLQAGPGMLWKKSDNFNVNISPAAAKLIFVDGDFTKVTGTAAIDAFNAAGGYFGVEANKTTRLELGASLRGYYKVDLMKNISMENLLGLYSNYLDNPQNVDIDYTMNLVMKVNKYISTNLVFQAIYDDNTIQAFQIREAFGLGFNAKF
ncbi:MAG TPA: DUF3078 domain-containing protein [Flavobacteriia bacterium]|nr:DUF3078 domain-containing protein [Flavobacteriia bacterium]